MDFNSKSKVQKAHETIVKGIQLMLSISNKPFLFYLKRENIYTSFKIYRKQATFEPYNRLWQTELTKNLQVFEARDKRI